MEVGFHKVQPNLQAIAPTMAMSDCFTLYGNLLFFKTLGLKKAVMELFGMMRLILVSTSFGIMA